MTYSKRIRELSVLNMSASDEAVLQQVVDMYFLNGSNDECGAIPTGTPIF